MVKCHKQQRGNQQPYLLALTHSGDEAVPDDLFLVLDYDVVRVPGTITKGIEMLFASFYAFRLEYPPSLVNVYLFFQEIFGLGAGPRRKRNLNPTVREFVQKIKQCADKRSVVSGE